MKNKRSLENKLDIDLVSQITMLLQITLAIFLVSFAIASLYCKELYLICQIIIGTMMFVISYNNHKVYKRKYMTAIYLGLGIVIISSALFAWKILYISTLFDYYGELLTTKQITYFKDYYFDNLTLSEISENTGVSRNAVHKTIKESEEKLLFYEEKLKLVSKSNKIKKIISNLDDETKNEILKLI